MQQRHHHKKGFELLRSNSETIAHKTRMGFSLVEAAIVLAVVGGVVGAIWVAAATVIENHRVNKTVEGIFSTARNIQNLISIRDAEMIGPDAYITNVVIHSNAAPKNWINGNKIKSPVGNNMSVRIKIDSNTRFRFEISDVMLSDCVRLINRISVIGAQSNRYNYIQGIENSGLGYIAIYESATATYHVNTSDFPVSIEQAKLFCEMPNPDDIDVFLGFGFTRINN